MVGWWWSGSNEARCTRHHRNDIEAIVDRNRKDTGRDSPDSIALLDNDGVNSRNDGRHPVEMRRLYINDNTNFPLKLESLRHAIVFVIQQMITRINYYSLKIVY